MQALVLYAFFRNKRCLGATHISFIPLVSGIKSSPGTQEAHDPVILPLKIWNWYGLRGSWRY